MTDEIRSKRKYVRCPDFTEISLLLHKNCKKCGGTGRVIKREFRNKCHKCGRPTINKCPDCGEDLCNCCIQDKTCDCLEE